MSTDAAREEAERLFPVPISGDAPRGLWDRRVGQQDGFVSGAAWQAAQPVVAPEAGEREALRGPIRTGAQHHRGADPVSADQVLVGAYGVGAILVILSFMVWNERTESGLRCAAALVWAVTAHVVDEDQMDVNERGIRRLRAALGQVTA